MKSASMFKFINPYKSMITVYLVIVNHGDGSAGIEWYKQTSLEELEFKAEEDCERYMGGDGLQVKKLEFPEGFDIEAFGSVNHIYWADEEDIEYDAGDFLE